MGGGASGDGSVRPIGDVIRRILRDKRFHEKAKYGGLVDTWALLVGDAVARKTRIVRFRGGELVVEVSSPALLHELNGFLKPQILAGLHASEGGRDVAALRFRLGQGAAGDGIS